MAPINKKTEQKGTDDEIAITNEGYIYFAAIGYFVVCPFLAAYTKMMAKKSFNPGTRRKDRNAGAVRRA